MTIGHINTKHSAQSTPAISRSTTTVSVYLLNTRPSCTLHWAQLWITPSFAAAPDCTAEQIIILASFHWQTSSAFCFLNQADWGGRWSPVRARSHCLLSPHSLKWMNQKVCQEALLLNTKQSPQHTRDISLFFVGIPQWQLDWGKTRQKTWWCNYNCVDILHGYNDTLHSPLFPRPVARQAASFVNLFMSPTQNTLGNILDHGGRTLRNISSLSGCSAKTSRIGTILSNRL